MARVVERISMGFDGAVANGSSRNAVLSENGRYVVFESDASNLVAGDTNGATDVFRYDILTGETIRVSVGNSGQSNGTSSNAVITADGTQVVFESLGDNLVAGDSNGLRDVFIRNIDTGVTTLVSENAAGDDASGGTYGSHNASVTTLAGYTYVTFASDATNLVGGDTNSSEDIFLKVVENDNVYRVSNNDSGSQSIGTSGPYVSTQIVNNQPAFVFASQAVLTADTGPFNGGPLPTLPSGYNVSSTEAFKLYLSDGASTDLVSVLTGRPAQANGHNFEPNLNYPYIAYTSTAYNLDSRDTNELADVYVYNHQTQTTYLASIGHDNSAANGASGNAHVLVDSVNTPWVVFTSAASNLVVGDTNGQVDVFLTQLLTGVTTRLTDPGNGIEANGASYSFAPGGTNFSLTDQSFVFTSDATNMVAGDTNGVADIFLLDEARGGTTVAQSSGMTAAVEQIAQVVDAAVTVQADSARLSKATVQITGNYVQGQDLLQFATIGTITGTFDAATGTLTMRGWGTVAEYQAALRTVTYLNSADAPTTGNRTISFVTEDGHSSSGQAQKTLGVSGVNDGVFVGSGLADQSLRTGTAFSYQIPVGAFSDPDGDSLTYTVGVLPSWLAFDAQTRTFSGMPGAGDSGVSAVSVTVSDGGFTVSDSFNLSLSNPAALSNSLVAENSQKQTVIGQFSGRDSSGANYTFALTADDPDNAAFRIVDGTLAVAKGAGLDFETRAAYDITVRTTDATGATYDETFTIALTNVRENPKGDDRSNALQGDAFDNIIDGRGGNDRLAGGDGADTFVLGKGYGRDVVTDFDPTQGDLIDLSDAVGVRNFKDLIKHHVEDIGSDLVITADDGSLLVLKGVDVSDLSREHFIF